MTPMRLTMIAALALAVPASAAFAQEMTRPTTIAPPAARDTVGNTRSGVPVAPPEALTRSGRSESLGTNPKPPATGPSSNDAH